MSNFTVEKPETLDQPRDQGQCQLGYVMLIACDLDMM